MPVDKFGGMDDVQSTVDGASLSYINNNFLRKDGTTDVTGSINMNGNTLTRVSNPVNPHDVATKDYVDNVVDLSLLKENGNYVAAVPINMGFQPIRNIPLPKESGDAASKDFVERSIVKPHVLIRAISNRLSPSTGSIFLFNYDQGMGSKDHYVVPTAGRIKKIAISFFPRDIFNFIPGISNELNGWSFSVTKIDGGGNSEDSLTYYQWNYPTTSLNTSCHEIDPPIEFSPCTQILISSTVSFGLKRNDEKAGTAINGLSISRQKAIESVESASIVILLELDI